MPEVSDQRIQPGAGRAWWHLSRTGLLFGAAYFLTSTAPSLLPRTWYYQGLISGLCAAAGYGLGVLVAWIVRWVARLIDLRVMIGSEARHWLLVAGPVFGAVAVLGLTVANVRSQARTAAVVRGLRAATHQLAQAAGHVLPKTIATVTAVLVVALTTAWVTDSVLFHRGMQAFAAVAAQVNTATDRGAIEPIRVYAGRTADRTVSDVADAVVAELQRTKAFNRRVLAVFTTTGTGWVDDWSAQSVEYLSNGDSAIA